MKESIYFRGRDIRAVENPYGAALELAGRMDIIYTAIFVELAVLALLLLPRILYYLGCLYMDITAGEGDALAAYRAVFSILGIYVAVLAVINLAASTRYFRDLRINNRLMARLHDSGDGEEENVSSGGAKGNPRKALMALIGNTAEQSEHLARSFRYIYAYVLLWIIGVWSYVFIQFFIQGSHLDTSHISWALPTILDGLYIFVVLALVMAIDSQFRFIMARYSAIEYAFQMPTIRIPRGDTPLERLDRYLRKLYARHSITPADNSGYFDAIYDTALGKIVVKGLDHPPSQRDVEEFRREATSVMGKDELERAIILFPGGDISDQVYDDILDRPLRKGRRLCSIQLIEEGEDGTYDFIPVLASPEEER